ncbi:MAG: DUF5018 domain-containing protein [Treponema sp.]|jgi:hypothetical protein|nr:DUF5018 domain-containing protein [Treponema sp.]
MSKPRVFSRLISPHPDRNTRNYPLAGFLPFFALFFTIFLASCTLSLTPVNVAFRSGITAFDLDNFVTPPQPDTLPRQSVDTGYYVMAFRWFDTSASGGEKELPVSTKFEPGRIYKVVLTLKPNSGFVFDDPATDALKFSWGGKQEHKGKGSITARTPDGGNITITIVFTKTGKIKIDRLDLRALEAPENDKSPVSSLQAGTGYTTSGITWFETTENGSVEFTGKFETGHNYTARAVFKADLRYSFEGLGKSGIIHNGEEAKLEPETPPEDCDTVTVTIKFYPAGTRGISHIDLGDITNPVAGEDAPGDYSSPEGAGYEVTAVEWSEDGEEFNLTPPFKFEMGKKYWARITLTPLPGYRFANLDDLEDRITHNGENVKVVAVNDGTGSIYIIIEYGELSAAIGTVDLSGIAAPLAGESPVRALDTKGLPFTVKEIRWDPEDGKFLPNENYEVTVELEAKAGYNFEGLAASGVLHHGSKAALTPASPPAGTTGISVTITFDSSGNEVTVDLDRDGDGLTDDEEAFHGTDPTKPDTDGDGFPDGWEVVNGHDPLNPNDPGRNGDEDKDGFPNGWEVDNGHDPLDPNDPPRNGDEDKDGFPNGWEADNGYDPLDPNDPPLNGDDDEDDLTNKEEYEEGTDPKNPDTDGDGFLDGWEVKEKHDPLDPDDPPRGGDEDGDGFPNGWEADNGYDPLDPADPNPNGDDDGDGYTNKEEYENGTDPHVSSKKSITAFSVTEPVQAAGTINEALKTITVPVPYGTAVTSMTASATHTGKTISPTPGTARNYTYQVSYTVTAEDKSVQTYKVTVQIQSQEPPKSSAANITGFTLAGASGSIGTSSISVTVPYGTSLGSLAPVITVSAGATVSPLSGVARNFTNPVTYTVTAEDGTQKTYTVTVSVAKSSAANITGFTLAGVSGSIGTSSISVTVPYGTSLGSLAPGITVSPGATVSPASGVAWNFNNPVTYTVTAENGTTQKTYTVTVTVAAYVAPPVYPKLNSFYVWGELKAGGAEWVGFTATSSQVYDIKMDTRFKKTSTLTYKMTYSGGKPYRDGSVIPDTGTFSGDFFSFYIMNAAMGPGYSIYIKWSE